MSTDGGVGHIGRRSAVWPVPFFPWKIRSRTRVDVSGDIERLLRCQSSRAIAWHQMMDERRGASDPRHARANVVGSRAPQWRSRRRLRRSRAAIAIGCMTCRACRRVDLSSPCGVANERIQFGNAQSLHRRSRRVAAREERDVRDHVAHVATFGSQRPAVQASLETVVDAILEQIHMAASSAILGESRVCADERHCVRHCSIGEVAVGAVQCRAGILRKTVARVVNQRATPLNGLESNRVLDLRLVGNSEGQGGRCCNLRRGWWCARRRLLRRLVASADKRSKSENYCAG